MPENKSKPITKEFIEKFLLEAQSHSGLPAINEISLYYVTALSVISVPDNLLDNVMNQFINAYMQNIHKLYIKNKTWKSYDW